MTIIRLSRRLLLGAALLPRPGLAQASWQPARPVRFLVGFAPGGSADLLARLLQGPLAQALGVPVSVENVSGAGGNIAMGQVARAAPDGLTLGLGATGTQAINPALYGARLGYRSPEDFTPITLLATQANAVLVNPDVPHGSVAEFVAYVRANPGTPFGSAGIGTSNHLAGELMNLRFGIRMEHVAYRGAVPVLADLIAGRIKMTVDNLATAVQYMQQGSVRAVAVTTGQRSPRLPDVPTLAESGAPGFDVTSWQGIFAPAGLTAPMVQRLHEAALAALRDPLVQARMQEMGFEPASTTPEAFAAFLAGERAKYAEVVRAANIRVD